jgi:hypothetical protein
VTIDAVTASNFIVSGATSDLTLGARGSTTTFNEVGDTALTGFTATSLIGGLNELKVVVGPIVLSTTAITNVASTVTTNLFTVPVGKTAIITGAILRSSVVVGSVTGGATGGIGVAAGEDDIIASTLWDGFISSTDTFYLTTAGGNHTTAVAPNVIKLGIDVGCTGGGSQQVTVDLLGYLV